MSVERARYIVGVDLGTTHTVVAYADTRAATNDGAAPPVLPFEIEQLVAPGEVKARPLLPSLRYHFAENELRAEDRALAWDEPSRGDDVPPGVVGYLARALGNKTPARLIPSAKSWLSHAQVDRSARILPWGAPADVPKISPAAASATYLAHVRAAWNARFANHPIEKQEVVLTVPASFDEGARALTLSAAKLAGFRDVRLVEEPQAAFYDWLARHRETLETELKDVRLALVCDVGGGTTDLTLIQVELRESGPRLTRIAVGEHLMLGGDNMDLAIARDVEAKLSPGAQLPPGRFAELLAQSREAKEALLTHNAQERATVTLLGSGSKLVGGAKSMDVTRKEIEDAIVDGFFPNVGIDADAQKRRAGIVEFGLPYAADAGITRHIATFLRNHASVAREALGDRANENAIPIPDALLLNGGVFKGAELATRLRSVLAGWRGNALYDLENDSPELAVAQGAVAFGLARRGIGIKIGGGSARSYHVIVDGFNDATRKAICLLPRGAEEGEEILLKSRSFALRLGEPVRFHLVASHADRQLRAGDLVDVEGDSFVDLPPIAVVLEADANSPKNKGDSKAREIAVHLTAELTEVGTLQVSAIADDESQKRWKLEMQLRGDAGRTSSEQIEVVTELHPRFRDATDAINRVFGKSTTDVDPKAIKTLRADLERILGARETWNTPLLRELFGALLAGVKRRRRSADHERVWFNLAGYCLRPGFGYPLDDWRVNELFALFNEGVQFAPEAQVWSEYWTMWRRIAGGLPQQGQMKVLDAIEFYLAPPSPRPRARPKGPKALGYDDMVRLAGALERVTPEKKVEVGNGLVARLVRHGEPAQTWWAVGRIGARVPFAKESAHHVVPRANVLPWIAELMRLDWKKVDQAAFAATQLARVSGDRERDIDENIRSAIAKRLSQTDAPPIWVSMVTEFTELGAAEEKRIFGESLPPGLRLLEIES